MTFPPQIVPGWGRRRGKNMPKKLRSLLLAAGVADILAVLLAVIYFALFCAGMDTWTGGTAQDFGEAIALVVVLIFWVIFVFGMPVFSLGILVTGIAECCLAAKGKMRACLLPWSVVSTVFSVLFLLMALFNFMMAAGADYFTAQAVVLFACMSAALCLLAAAQLACKGFLLACIRRERKNRPAAAGAEGEPLPPA